MRIIFGWLIMKTLMLTFLLCFLNNRILFNNNSVHCYLNPNYFTTASYKGNLHVPSPFTYLPTMTSNRFIQRIRNDIPTWAIEYNKLQAKHFHTMQQQAATRRQSVYTNPGKLRLTQRNLYNRNTYNKSNNPTYKLRYNTAKQPPWYRLHGVANVYAGYNKNVPINVNAIAKSNTFLQKKTFFARNGKALPNTNNARINNALLRNINAFARNSALTRHYLTTYNPLRKSNNALPRSNTLQSRNNNTYAKNTALKKKVALIKKNALALINNAKRNMKGIFIRNYPAAENNNALTKNNIFLRNHNLLQNHNTALSRNRANRRQFQNGVQTLKNNYFLQQSVPVVYASNFNHGKTYAEIQKAYLQQRDIYYEKLHEKQKLRTTMLKRNKYQHQYSPKTYFKAKKFVPYKSVRNIKKNIIQKVNSTTSQKTKLLKTDSSLNNVRLKSKEVKTKNNSQLKSIVIHEDNMQILKKRNQTTTKHKKAFVPHSPVTNPKGRRRHHIFHETISLVENNRVDDENNRVDDENNPVDEWEVKKFHVYHKINPDSFLNQSPLPYFTDDENILDDGSDNVDDIDNEDEEDLTDDEDITGIKHSKVPIVNIETSNMNDVPEDIKNQIENRNVPEYNIDKGIVESPSELQEQVIPEFKAKHLINKDEHSVRKSILSDGNIFTDFLHGDMAAAQRNKDKMSEEELEAIQEDNVAKSLMKSPDKSKIVDQPEVFGLDKTGMSPADKTLISASLINGAVPDSSATEHGDVDTSNIDEDTMMPANSVSHHKNKPLHDDIPISDELHYDKPTSSESMKSAYQEKVSEHAVDKTSISESDGDFHNLLNDINSFKSSPKEKSSDFETYENNVDSRGHEGNDDDDRLIEEDSNHENFSNSEDHSEEIEGNQKDIELTLTKGGIPSVEDTIKKLQNSDSEETDNFVKKFTSQHKTLLPEEEEEPPPERKDQPSYVDEKKEETVPARMKTRHRYHPHRGKLDYHLSHYADPGKENDSEDEADILDPEKAQERMQHLTEQAEIARKLNHPIQEQAGMEEMMVKGSSLKKLTKVAREGELIKFDGLTPEDALRALNGKHSLTGDTEENNSHNNGPPDAVVNGIPTERISVKQNIKATVPSRNTTLMGDVTTKYNETKNSTNANIVIDNVENSTVSKEVVNILESLGQLKNKNSEKSGEGDINQTKALQEIMELTQNPEVKVESKEIEQHAHEKKSIPKTENDEGIQRAKVVNTTAIPTEAVKTITTTPATPTSVDIEEKETQEAVRDLNIAIGILEKKLALITAAKRSGSKKEIYIVDQTLRNPKDVAKSTIENRNNHDVTKSINNLPKTRKFESPRITSFITKTNLVNKEPFSMTSRGHTEYYNFGDSEEANEKGLKEVKLGKIIIHRHSDVTHAKQTKMHRENIKKRYKSTKKRHRHRHRHRHWTYGPRHYKNYRIFYMRGKNPARTDDTRLLY